MLRVHKSFQKTSLRFYVACMGFEGTEGLFGVGQLQVHFGVFLLGSGWMEQSRTPEA